ncbi:hypothetical protein BDZ97DRAFT_1921258 [Flammula alnicola]|nr:hypothetical protein BDZ97DRAFT_1921258 [Flammula alnicola]
MTMHFELNPSLLSLNSRRSCSIDAYTPFELRTVCGTTSGKHDGIEFLMRRRKLLEDDVTQRGAETGWGDEGMSDERGSSSEEKHAPKVLSHDDSHDMGVESEVPATISQCPSRFYKVGSRFQRMYVAAWRSRLLMQQGNSWMGSRRCRDDTTGQFRLPSAGTETEWEDEDKNDRRALPLTAATYDLDHQSMHRVYEMMNIPKRWPSKIRQRDRGEWATV